MSAALHELPWLARAFAALPVLALFALFAVFVLLDAALGAVFLLLVFDAFDAAMESLCGFVAANATGGGAEWATGGPQVAHRWPTRAPRVAHQVQTF